MADQSQSPVRGMKGGRRKGGGIKDRMLKVTMCRVRGLCGSPTRVGWGIPRRYHIIHNTPTSYPPKQRLLLGAIPKFFPLISILSREADTSMIYPLGRIWGAGVAGGRGGRGGGEGGVGERGDTALRI